MTISEGFGMSSTNISGDTPSILCLIRNICSSIWIAEQEKKNIIREFPENLEKKMFTKCYEIILKGHHLCPDEQNKELSWILFKHFYKTLQKDEDFSLFTNYDENLKNMKKKYESTSAVFQFIAEMSGTEPKRRIKPNEMLSCFYFGMLKHCVPISQRSQTLQDQFAMLENNSDSLSQSSMSTHNPFQFPKNFRNSNLIIETPSLNLNKPRTLNLPDEISQSFQKDEGYVTPDSNNIIEEANDIVHQKKQIRSKSERPFTFIKAWNILDNYRAPKEKDFITDFQLLSKEPLNSNSKIKSAFEQSSMVNLSKVIMMEKNEKDFGHTKLFEILKSSEEISTDLKYLLMGAPSLTFFLNKDKNKFVCQYGVFSEHISPETLAKFFEPALECGNFRIMFQNLPSDRKLGFVYQNFLRCIKECLRQFDENILSYFPGTSQFYYIELQEFIYSCYHQLNYLAQLCTPDILRGAELINHIYEKAVCSLLLNDKLISIMLARILENSINTYFSLLEKWLFHGDCFDPFKEFLVAKGPCNNFKTRQFWTKGFHLESSQCPTFLVKYENQIFACGKNICLLKLTNPEDPLFSIKFDQIPTLKFCLTKQYLDQFNSACQKYEKSIVDACGVAPDLCKLLKPEEHSLEQMINFQKQALVRQQDYIRKIEEERLNKREKQAEERKKILQEIEEAEERKRKEKEREYKQDLKVLEEAKKMDEKYERIKQEEKQRIEEYYRELMSIIEQRQDTMKNKTKHLETFKTILKSKVQLKKKDSVDGSAKSVISSKIVSASAIDLPPSSTTDDTVESSSAISEDVDNIFYLAIDLPDPPNVELLMQKIEKEEESIRLTQETQLKLENLKASRLEARLNRNRVLSCEYNIFTGEKNMQSNLKVKTGSHDGYPDEFDSVAKEEADENRKKMMSSDIHNIGKAVAEKSNTTPMEHSTIITSQSSELVDKEKQSSTGDEQTREETLVENQDISQLNKKMALAIKQKVLFFEYDMNVPIKDNKALKKKTAQVDKPENKQNKCKMNLTAHEEAVRNRKNVLSNEFHFGAMSQSKSCKADDEKGSSEKDEQVKNQISSDEEKVVHPTPLESSQSQPSNEILGVDETNQIETENGTSSQSVTSSSENLVTVISCEPEHSQSEENKELNISDKDDNIRSESLINNEKLLNSNKMCLVNINNLFNESLIENDSLLDITLVEKYLHCSVQIPLYLQYKLTNAAVVRLFVEKHHLPNHLITLRNYFFLLDGSFAKSITDDLSKQIRNNLVLLLNPFRLNNILRRAISYSTCNTKMESNLTFAVKNYSTIETLNESNIFEYLTLSYKVEWPLNIVITPEALTNYDKVFVFLMQVQRVSWTLKEVYAFLNKKKKKMEAEHLYIYRQIHLFRHVMMQVIGALQSYIHSSVLELPWQELVETFKKPVTLDSIYYRHVEYVKQIMFRCLLNKRSHGMADALKQLFNTILLFYDELKKRALEKNYEPLLGIFQKFLKISLYFHDYLKKMVKHNYQEHNLDFLLHLLSLNDYFSRETQ